MPFAMNQSPNKKNSDAHGKRETAMRLNGQFSGIELIDLLQLLSLGKKTGALLVQNNDEWILLYVTDGKLSSMTVPAFLIHETYEPFLCPVNDSNIDSYSISQPPAGLESLFTNQRKIESPFQTPLTETASSLAQNLMIKILSWPEGEFTFSESPFAVDNYAENEIVQCSFSSPLEITDLLLLVTKSIDEIEQVFAYEDLDVDANCDMCLMDTEQPGNAIALSHLKAS